MTGTKQTKTQTQIVREDVSIGYPGHVRSDAWSADSWTAEELSRYPRWNLVTDNHSLDDTSSPSSGVDEHGRTESVEYRNETWPVNGAGSQ